MKSRTCLLMILDGWGINPSTNGNAFHIARTPCLDRLKNEHPSTQLVCSGKAVGLPDGIMGNSEVGHLNIGAGRVVYQDLLRIDMAIDDGSFYNNEAINALMTQVKKKDSGLHLMGLVSDAGVHSQLDHLFALLDHAKQNEINRVYVHAITDGRDTPPESGAGYLNQLQEYIRTNRYGQIATVCGRYYAMDRDNRWNRIEKAYRLYVEGNGIKTGDPVTAVKAAYGKKETDEFIQPVVVTGSDDLPVATIGDRDGVIFFNFRADRAREITRALTDEDFTHFNRERKPELCGYVCMTTFDESFDLPVAFPPVHLEKILGEVISREGLRQLRIAETEKYAHVTYFFNGGEEKPFPAEDRCLIPSPRDIPTYDLKPEMSAYEVTEEVVARLDSEKYSLIVLNFANMDMVGHTGNLDAAVRACEAVDQCAKRIIARNSKLGGITLVTADHGNSEKMVSEDGGPYTAHTVNPVPFILIDDQRKTVKLKTGRLGDIAPTILELMGIEKPEQMTGRSLIEKKG